MLKIHNFSTVKSQAESADWTGEIPVTLSETVGASTMIILVLLTTLASSLATAGALALFGAGWWQIAAGYVAGGMAGMCVALGFVLLMLRRNGADGDDTISDD